MKSLSDSYKLCLGNSFMFSKDLTPCNHGHKSLQLGAKHLEHSIDLGASSGALSGAAETNFLCLPHRVHTGKGAV